MISCHCCSNSTSDSTPYVAAAYLPQCAKHFDVALVTCTTLADIFICLGLAFGAIMLQAGLALLKVKAN